MPTANSQVPQEQWVSVPIAGSECNLEEFLDGLEDDEGFKNFIYSKIPGCCLKGAKAKVST